MLIKKSLPIPTSSKTPKGGRRMAKRRVKIPQGVTTIAIMKEKEREKEERVIQRELYHEEEQRLKQKKNGKEKG